MIATQEAKYIEISQDEFTRDSGRWAERAVAGETVLFRYNGKVLKLEEADPLDNVPPYICDHSAEEGIRRGFAAIDAGEFSTMEEVQLSLQNRHSREGGNPVTRQSTSFSGD